MKDDLSHLLHDWSETPSEDPGFNRAVWSRIEASSAPAGWIERALRAIARPRVAVAILGVAVASGVLAGAAMTRDAGPEAYLRSVNPYAMNR